MGVARHIRFNRPERLNALTPLQHVRVMDALDEAEADPKVRVIAFSGEGRAFCAGDDISGERHEWPARYSDRRVDLNIGVGPLILQDVTSRIRHTRKPTVALMHGYAIGAGYDYATSCDFRLAEDGCLFGDPRVHRALWAAEGWSYKLTRLVGYGYAARIGLLGELLPAEEALGIGLVHGLLPQGIPVVESSQPFLARLGAHDLDAYAYVKHQMLKALDLPARAADL